MDYKIFSLILLAVLTFSCSSNYSEEEINDNDEVLKERTENFVTFLKDNQFNLSNTSISVLTPEHCGSCTEETINWLVKHYNADQYETYQIMLTDSLSEEHRGLMADVDYEYHYIESEKLGRLGYSGLVSNNFQFKGGKLVKEVTIKEQY